MWGNDSGEGGAFGDQPNAHPVVGDEDGARRVVPRFVAHMESLGLEVRLTALPGGALGLYEPDDKRITLSPDQSWPSLVHPAKIERHVPALPFSREAATLPTLRKTLAAYRLAFGQPRQEDFVEFLGTHHSDSKLMQLTDQLHIDLSPPDWS